MIGVIKRGVGNQIFNSPLASLLTAAQQNLEPFKQLSCMLCGIEFAFKQ